jgi:hypothetical protein
VNNLQNCRAQEARCRSRAASDEQNRDLWLSMAERWSYLAREAPFCFMDSDLSVVPGDARSLPHPAENQR